MSWCSGGGRGDQDQFSFLILIIRRSLRQSTKLLQRHALHPCRCHAPLLHALKSRKDDPPLFANCTRPRRHPLTRPMRRAYQNPPRLQTIARQSQMAVARRVRRVIVQLWTHEKEISRLTAQDTAGLRCRFQRSRTLFMWANRCLHTRGERLWPNLPSSRKSLLAVQHPADDRTPDHLVRHRLHHLGSAGRMVQSIHVPGVSAWVLHGSSGLIGDLCDRDRRLRLSHEQEGS